MVKDAKCNHGDAVSINPGQVLPQELEASV
jgi:hypothetical protein